MPSVLPDPATPLGARVRARLADEGLIWLTSTSADGTPQPNPVWFLWDGAESVLVYNDIKAVRLAHVAARPQVSLHFDGDGKGGDIIVIAGRAEPATDVPLPDRHDDYLAKYATGIAQLGTDPAGFAARWSVPLRIRFTKVRGH